MQDNIQREILKAFFLVLRPLARIFLRFGISYRQFEQISKAAFVDVATSDFGIRGRPTNISRVAVMTGMTRKEVRRIRDELSAGDDDFVSIRNQPLANLLHNWAAEKEFLDDSGGPAVLPYEGERGSFERLVKFTGGDIPPGAIRTELKRVGAIEVDDQKRIRLVKRSFIAEKAHDRLIGTVAQCVYPLMAAVAHNTNPDMVGDTWPNSTAYSHVVQQSEAPRLRRIAADRIQAFAEAMDDVFTSYEILREEPKEGDRTVSVYVGSFFYVDELENRPNRH